MIDHELTGSGGYEDIIKYCIGVGIAGIVTMSVTIMAYNDEEANRCIK